MKEKTCSNCVWVKNDDGCANDMRACRNYSEWKEKVEKIQMTEEQAIDIISMCFTGCYLNIADGVDSFLSQMRKYGYIKKSIVEEAEEMLRDWINGHNVKIDDMVKKALESMDILKSENERLKNDKQK